MALPTFVGAGPKAAVGTGAVQALYTGVAFAEDDIGLLAFESLVATVTVDQGYAQHPVSPITQGNTRLHIFWKRLAASETGPTITQTAGANHVCGGITVYRGCETSGDPWDVYASATDAVADTSAEPPTLTTTVDECLVAFMTSADTDSNTDNQVTAASGANLANVALRMRYNTSLGGGGGAHVATGELAAAGSTGLLSMTMANATVKAMASIALKPPAPAVAQRPFPLRSPEPRRRAEMRTRRGSYR